MSGEDVYVDLERQLHHGFKGREELIGELGGQLLENPTDGCVALIGGSGVGKSAATTTWVAQGKARHELVFGHFIRAQHGDRAEPLVIAGSLARQIETQFPNLRNPYARPEARLAQLLVRVSAQELIPHGRRMVLVVDGLDERTAVGDLRKLLSWLPRSPSGIRLLLSGRLRDRLRDLESVGHPLALVDLDDPLFAADNEATVAAYWHREAAALGFDDTFAAHASRRSGGNMLHAALLRKHVASVAYADCLDAIPRDVRALLTLLWERVRDDRSVARALDILCAAREPLSLEQIGRVARLSDAADLLSFGRLASELVIELRGGVVVRYALFHEAVRSFLVERLGAAAVRALNRELADKLAMWPPPSDPAARRYALRHAIGHRIAAGDHEAIRALVGNIDFLELKCRELGIDDVELDLRRAAEASATAGQLSLHGELDRLLRLLASESRVLSRDTGVDASPLWDRLRRDRPPSTAAPRAPASIGSAVVGPFTAKPGPAAPSIIRRNPPATTMCLGRPPLLGLIGTRGVAVTACAITPDSARVIAAYADLSIHIYEIDSGHRLKRLTGHGATIQACAVSPDGRWLVSASEDQTLKLWELESGDEVATLVGHTGPVMSCSVTPDGSHVVSGSADRTVRVWDVGAASCTATLQGHTGAVEDCAVSPDGSWVVSASADTTLKVWDLERLCLLDTFTGHIDAVESCAVAPDGRYVVSGSSDHTLRSGTLAMGA